ncbi:LOW QUALITY PROTEIN: hypothetical protein HID58_031632 [Brassica napus]|uniref:DC1 domain-containing protein n=1 Tax=Brassica napus TaxID=3708 RepID=A0ABQ8BU01_BRANA|nr:LOW QUALITY PROTEIN: hypothetical protein HID58_031632 [Brassica napus]
MCPHKEPHVKTGFDSIRVNSLLSLKTHSLFALSTIISSVAMKEQNIRCSACTHPIGLQSFYGCTECDFSLHQKCAECPTRKWHVLHNERLTLVTNKELEVFDCYACKRKSNGFMYKHGNKNYAMVATDGNILSSSDCGFVLGFTCATVPQVVNHRVDDHPLSLCYSEEEEASGKYWSDICERETNPNNWFYTCKDHLACLHIKCVLGDSSGFIPRSVATCWTRSFEVVSMIVGCKSRCMYPINLKLLGTSSTYICSINCASHWRGTTI